MYCYHYAVKVSKELLIKYECDKHCKNPQSYWTSQLHCTGGCGGAVTTKTHAFTFTNQRNAHDSHSL